MCFGKEVAQDLAGATEAEELLDLRRLEYRLFGPEAGHWGNEHRTKFEIEQRFGGNIRLGPDMDLLGTVGNELHGRRPAVIMLEFYLHLVPKSVGSVSPE